MDIPDLATLPPDDAEELVGRLAMLAAGDAADRATALTALANLGPAARFALREVAAALFDAADHVRRRAADLLAGLGPLAAPAAPALAALLHDADESLRLRAIAALGAVGPAAAAAGPAVWGLLAGPDAGAADTRVRAIARTALARVYPADAGRRTAREAGS